MIGIEIKEIEASVVLYFGKHAMGYKVKPCHMG